MPDKKKKHNIYTVMKDVMSGKSDKSTTPKGEKPPGNFYEAMGHKKKGKGVGMNRKATTPDISRETPKSTMPAPPYPKPKKILDQ